RRVADDRGIEGPFAGAGQEADRAEHGREILATAYHACRVRALVQQQYVRYGAQLRADWQGHRQHQRLPWAHHLAARRPTRDLELHAPENGRAHAVRSATNAAGNLLDGVIPCAGAELVLSRGADRRLPDGTAQAVRD